VEIDFGVPASVPPTINVKAYRGDSVNTMAAELTIEDDNKEISLIIMGTDGTVLLVFKTTTTEKKPITVGLSECSPKDEGPSI